MKSLLVGNGINIQFGGNAYRNDFIMKRVKFRAKLDCYKKLFNGKLNSDEIIKVFNDFANIANDIKNNKYDKFIDDKDEDTKEALCDFKSRYASTEIDYPHDIMLEDWFFILHMFFLANYDMHEKRTAAKQGFEELILDAIYNSGNIQDIYKKMNAEVRRYLSEFDNIFSLNYDNNLEKVTGKPVYHLHGDYSVLADSENTHIVSGFLREEKKERVVTNGMEHCFCNALLNYSGKLKLKEAEENHKLIEATKEYMHSYKNDKNFKAKFDDFLLCLKKTHPDIYEKIETKIKHPDLEMATEYYFEKFKDIKDELYIIGMSPNNDGHIFDCINNNRNLKKVHFYYLEQKDKDYICTNFSVRLYSPDKVSDLWTDLHCRKTVNNYNYKVPNNIDKFIDCFNGLSDDLVSKKQIMEELNTISQSKMDRLCELVNEDMVKRNPNHKSTDKEGFIKSSASISYIALQEGILPSTLYLIYVNELSKIKD